MATIANVEAIFLRQGWHFTIEHGNIVAIFDNVPIVISAFTSGARVGSLVVRGPVAQARIDDVESFLDAVNLEQTGGYLELNPERGSIFFWAIASLTGATTDDRRLAEAIRLAVLAVKGVGPVASALASGRISLAQALAQVRRSGGQAA